MGGTDVRRTVSISVRVGRCVEIRVVVSLDDWRSSEGCRHALDRPQNGVLRAFKALDKAVKSPESAISFARIIIICWMFVGAGIGLCVCW